MQVENHQIVGARSAILDTTGTLTRPKYLICHYTAGGSVASTLDALNGDEKKSYHVIIDRDGTVYQVAPFNVTAAHAGVSNWKGLAGLNGHSIGVSLANYGGWLKKMAGGNIWKAPGGAEFGKDEILEAEHHIGLTDKTAWERFPAAQLAALYQVVAAIADAYPSIIDAMGHDEVAMGRREDPGPAFPWDKIHAFFPNRSADVGPQVTVNSPGDGFASLRSRRSASSREIRKLAHGTRLQMRAFAYTHVTGPDGKKKAVPGDWASVAALGGLDHIGFVHRSLLT